MELHPILERGVVPRSDLWYVLSATGDSPSMRVGHTCTHVTKPDSNGKLYFVGGANPSGAFAEVCALDLDSQSWDVVDCSGLKARYEHSAFVPTSHPGMIYIFGGADQFGSLNDIQVFDTSSSTCCSITCSGTPPSPRTFHNGPCLGDKLFVYSGGDSGTDPVGDRQVYCFDAAASTWSTIRSTGNPPKPRLGHVMVTVGDKIFIHGGMSGTTFYSDLHFLDLSKNSWTEVKQKKLRPPPRTGHSSFVSGSDVYIFGGMNRDGALDDMYKLDSVTMTWSEVKSEGSPPSNRLDFATSIFRLKIFQQTSLTADGKENLSKQNKRGVEAGEVAALEGENKSVLSEIQSDIQSKEHVFHPSDFLPETLAQESENHELNESMAKCNLEEADHKDGASTSYVTVKMGLVHGGMDTEGEIFDDGFIFMLRTIEL